MTSFSPLINDVLTASLRQVQVAAVAARASLQSPWAFMGQLHQKLDHPTIRRRYCRYFGISARDEGVPFHSTDPQVQPRFSWMSVGGKLLGFGLMQRFQT